MRIAATHSHLHGLEHVKIWKNSAWEELCAGLLQSDDEVSDLSEILTRLRFYLDGKNWVCETGGSQKSGRFSKDRVSVQLDTTSDIDSLSTRIGHHLFAYQQDQIDVGIEILPMKSMQKHMSSGPAYYEGELYNVIRNGRGVPSVPLVLVGIEP
ncbi:MAG: hypothetical protein KDI75_08865 [Xanthomonadales bacterium]|nr:hypothetical protein [Xanthomonadales bacterium]